MPDKCSVPGCTSNYKYAGVPDFKLPTGPLERVQTWLRAIHRENISDVKTIFVCVKHFREEHIIKKFQILQPVLMIAFLEKNINYQINSRNMCEKEL